MQVAASSLEDVEFEFPIKPIVLQSLMDPSIMQSFTCLITNASIIFDRSHKLIDGQITLTIHEYMTYTDAVKSIVKSFGYYVDIEDLKCDLISNGNHNNQPIPNRIDLSLIRYKLNVLNPKNIKFMNKLVFTRIQISESTISVETAVDWLCNRLRYRITDSFRFG